jgi:hypothetical protein
MELDKSFYARAGAIRWLSRCGDGSRPNFGLPVRWAEDRKTALQSMFSGRWTGAMTAAEGQLVGYLSKQDQAAYGTHWEELVKESRTLLKAAIGTGLVDAIKTGGWAESLAQTPLPGVDQLLRVGIGLQLGHRLEAKAWEQCISYPILLCANLAALEIAARGRFREAPVFFERLLQVYEAGRLPCGWESNLEDWPEGTLVVY